MKEAFRALVGRCTCPPGLPVCACGARRAPSGSSPGEAVQATEAEVERNPRARSAQLGRGEDAMSRKSRRGAVSRRQRCWGSCCPWSLLLRAARARWASSTSPAACQVVDAATGSRALEAESRTLARENDRLKLELATLKRPARLEAIAREQLGMAAAATPRWSTRSPPARAAARPTPPRAGARWPTAAPRVIPRGPPSVDVRRRSSPAGPAPGCW